MNRGAAAEALAADFLAGRGLTIVARNYRCRGGEIDLIARERDILVFVEVRLRSGEAFGGAAASITATKRRRLERAAGHYLARIGREPPCRFDAVLLDSLDSRRIEWLKDV
ncbi:MAG TPA: YraN family protein [Casimicrobiaceae bacterium]|nr:YraN family protein [Casimicrobiaceae bacterium]